MPFRSDRERRAAFRRMATKVPARRKPLRNPSALPFGGVRGRGRYGRVDEERLTDESRVFHDHLGQYVHDGQIVAEGGYLDLHRVEATMDLLDTYRSVVAYELDRLAAKDRAAAKKARHARKALEDEMRARGTSTDVVRAFRSTIQDAVLHEANRTDMKGDDS